MARRRAAFNGPRGGDRIPTLRAPRVSLAAALLACALGGVLAAYPAIRANGAVEGVTLLGLAGVAAVILTLSTSVKLLPLPLLLLAASVEVHHLLEPAPRLALAAFAGCLLLLGELVAWSLSLRTLAVIDRGVVLARIGFFVAATVGASALAAAMLGASTVRLTGGLGDAAIGTVAAVLLLAAIAMTAHRLR